ncbi:MAG: hypothetical protein DRI57_21240 [Deltaproteobacteria bacterium]|nr:MAG: hypothetical protein DRI57_21240 [Deltaproteobacteria bacterium]
MEYLPLSLYYLPITKFCKKYTQTTYPGTESPPEYSPHPIDPSFWKVIQNLESDDFMSESEHITQRTD